MNFSAPFIRRPIGTILLAIGLFLIGVVAYVKLPVGALPSIDFPAVFINAQYPGASPEIMASTVAAPIERHVGEISGVTELTSVSSLGNTVIITLFDLDRNVDGAARDVQAALNAAATDLPAGLPNVPIFRKANPNNAPVLILALTSNQMSAAEIYDAADSVLLQRVSQVDGVSEVSAAGADQPAVRVTADPKKLSTMGLSMDDIRTTIVNANAVSPTGAFEGQIYGRSLATNDQLKAPKDYRNLVIKNASGTSVLLSDVAKVENSTRNNRSQATFNGVPAVLLYVRKQANANVIETVDHVKELLPQLQRFLPGGIKISILSDRTTSIRTSVADMTLTLFATIVLVMMVVFVFLRRITSTAAAGVTVPLALAGTCACMYAAGFSIDNISLMALVTSVGFVVDDAIVMIETIDKNRDAGMKPMQAALAGSRQIGFTVISISVSLMAAFIPLLLLGGLPGRLFHEFSMTLAFAIIISTIASLTITPMICANFTSRKVRQPNRFDRLFEAVLSAVVELYSSTLRVVLRHRFLGLLGMIGTVVATVFLFIATPKGFFPDDDTDLIIATTDGAPSISYQAIIPLQNKLAAIVRADPAVAGVGSSLGNPGGGPNSTSSNEGKLYIALKPSSETGVTAKQVIDRLRPKLRKVVGMDTFLLAWTDLHFGGRDAKGSQQFTLSDNDYAELTRYAPLVEERLKKLPELVDVSTDHEAAGLQANVIVDRTAASRLGVTMANVDNALNNSFSQRQISTLYSPRNQYRVVLESPASQLRQLTDLTDIYVPAGVSLVAQSGLGGGSVQIAQDAGGNNAQPLATTTGASTQTGSTSGTQSSSATVGTSAPLANSATNPSSTTANASPTGQVRLASMAHVEVGTAPLTVNHQGQFPEVTISYNLKAGTKLEVAQDAVSARRRRHAPARRAARRVHRQFQAVPAERRVAGPAALCGAVVDLHRAGRALREPGAPADDHLDPALGGARRAAGPAGHRDGTDPHRLHRHRAVDRHRQEERHHAGRFRAACRAVAGPGPGGGDLPGLPRTVPPDPDDDARRPARRRAADHRVGAGLGAAPAARHHHRRRPARLAGAHPLHDAGRLPLPRQAAPLPAPPAAAVEAAPARARPGGVRQIDGMSTYVSI